MMSYITMLWFDKCSVLIRLERNYMTQEMIRKVIGGL